MARPRTRKGVMPGFPKLAYYTGPEKNISVHTDRSFWSRKAYKLMPNELVVLVAEGTKLDYTRRVGYYYEQIPIYYIVPLIPLEKGETPITSIYNWKQNYRNLFQMDKKYFVIIEKDSGKRPAETVVAI